MKSVCYSLLVATLAFVALVLRVGANAQDDNALDSRLSTAIEAGTSGEGTQNWTFNHLGVLVSDMERTVEFLKSVGGR